MVRPLVILVTVAALVPALPRIVEANGRLPGSNRIVLSPTNPDLVIVRTTYGILPSFDDGTTWTFLCEDALGLPQTATLDPALALTADGALVAGISPAPAGLSVSVDTGCSWNCVGGPLAGQAIVDLAIRPNTPDAVVVLASTFLPNDAGGAFSSQVFESLDDGAHWTTLGTSLDPSVLVTTIEVAASDPNRLYVSGTRGFGNARTASLFASLDDGATWTEWPLPLDPSSPSPIYIGGVDPVDADRVYIRTATPSSLLVTSDGGQSFQSVLSFTGLMQGFALSPDGSKIYAGGEDDGLFVGDRATLTFAKQSTVHVQCLATRGAELWACADDQVSGFLAGVSTDDGQTFAPKLHLGSVGAPIACGAADPGPFACGADAGGAQCSGAPFTQLCASVGCALDSGLTRASTEDGATDDGASHDTGAPSTARRTSSSCACAFAGAGAVSATTPGALAFVFGVAAAALRRGGRRRRREWR